MASFDGRADSETQAFHYIAYYYSLWLDLLSCHANIFLQLLRLLLSLAQMHFTL